MSVVKPKKRSLRHSKLAIHLAKYKVSYVDFESAAENNKFLQPEEKIWEKTVIEYKINKNSLYYLHSPFNGLCNPF